MTLPLLYIKNSEISFGNKLIFADLSLQINTSEKICLIGRNGSGKSTLMKLLVGSIEADKGEFFIKPGIIIGYLPQDFSEIKDQSIYEYVLSNIKLEVGEHKEEKKYLADIIFKKLELNGDDNLTTLSGGRLRRAYLAKALIQTPDILLLDEPTNHLDIAAIEWLEDYIKNYNGAVICISHDRKFLANISNKTFWLDRGKLRINNRGFAVFEEWSTNMLIHEELELQRLHKKLDAENLWLQQGVTARRKRNQGRLKALFNLREKLKSDKENFKRSSSVIKLPPIPENLKSKMIIEMDEVSYFYTPEIPLIKNFSIRILRGEKIGIVGKNGSGKTTFLNLITSNIKPMSGKIYLNNKLEISYFDQKRESLNPDLSLWKTMCPEGGDMVYVAGKHRHVVAYLKDFLFDSKQINSPVSSLSGGEANRLLLAKILANPGSLLILDEPTNDLDMDSLDILQDILSDYAGNLIIVSHDRDFLDRIVTRTLVFNGDADIADYIGGYSDYIKEQPKISDKKPLNKIKQIKEPRNNNRPSKLSYKDQRELELLPHSIENLTREIKYIELQLADSNLYNANPIEFLNLTNLLESKKTELDKLETRYLELLELEASK